MTQPEDACPFEAAVRAQACAACCATTELPPCARAWIQSRLGSRLAGIERQLEAVPLRRAA